MKLLILSQVFNQNSTSVHVNVDWGSDMGSTHCIHRSPNHQTEVEVDQADNKVLAEPAPPINKNETSLTRRTRDNLSSTEIRLLHQAEQLPE